MEEIEFVCTYLYDLLIFTKSTFHNLLVKLEVVLPKFHKAGLRINIAKSMFATNTII